MEKRIARQEKILDRQLEWIRASDSKIPPMVILNSAMLAALATLAPDPGCWTFGMWVLAGITTILLITGLVFLTLSAIPRTGKSKGSKIYFDSVRRMSLRSYRRAMRGITDESYWDDLVEQSYRNAEIASKKFRSARTAMIIWMLSVVPWTLTLYFFLNTTGCAES